MWETLQTIIFARHHNSIHAVMVASKNATMVASKNDQVCKVSHIILHTRHTMSHTNMKLAPDMSQRVYVSCSYLISSRSYGSNLNCNFNAVLSFKTRGMLAGYLAYV